MAERSGSPLSRERLASLAAVEALAIATALAFGRVFAGSSASWRLVAAAAASALLASLLERRSLALATLAAAGGLVLAITWLTLPDTARFGLPTRATLDALAQGIAHVGQQARDQVSPTPPLVPLLLASVTAVWAAAFSIHALAVRAASPLLALVPAVALVGFADSALKGATSLGFAALLLAAAVAVLLADGIRRVRQWGAVRPWRGRSGRSHVLIARGAGGVAALTIIAAVLLPGVLPGFGARGLIDLRSNGDGTAIDPLVSISSTLNRKTTQELFRVRAPQAAYWRMLALDRFDGTTWSTGDLDASAAPAVQSGQRTVYTEPPAESQSLTQHVTVESDLGFPWIPVAYSPEQISFDQAAYRYNKDLSMAVAPTPLESGETYQAQSRFRTPTAQELEAESYAPSTHPLPFTELPDSLPDEIGAIAREWTRRALTPYDKIMAIQDHLLSPGFRYDTTVDPSAGEDAMVAFLTRTHAGFCQQFAGTMAVLIRSLGYPARVAVGFTPGTDNGDGTWTVTTQDAHAWVEVLFPDYGWLAFEPTPHRTNPTAESYLAATGARCPSGDCAGGGRKSPGVGGRTGAAGDPRLVRAARKRPPAAPVGAAAARKPGGEPFPTGRIVLLLLALGVAALVLVPPLKLLRRRLRLAGAARRPRELVLATYDVFGARAGDLGLPRHAGETMREYDRRLREAVRFSDGDLELLTAIASRAAYAPGEVGGKDAAEAQRAARRAFRDIRRERGRARQMLGIYRRGL